MMAQNVNTGGHKPNSYHVAQLNTLGALPSGSGNYNGVNNYGNSEAMASGVPSTAVANRQSHKRNSNGGGMSTLGRTGMMTPNGFLSDPTVVKKPMHP